MTDEEQGGAAGGGDEAPAKRRPRRRAAGKRSKGAGAGEVEPSVEQAVEAIYSYAAGLLASGRGPSEVEDLLIERGVDRDAAATVVDRLMEARQRGVAEAGRKNMLYGGLWCVGGTIVTLATYSAASNGGSYVVAWGAIIFGAIQFFRGLSQSSQGGR